MNEHPVDREPPQRILLATDLISACDDRALDRAIAITRDWGSSLHVLHAVAAAPPEVMRRRHVLATGTDLTAIGRARHIMDAIPGDLLVVRAIRPAQS